MTARLLVLAAFFLLTGQSARAGGPAQWAVDEEGVLFVISGSSLLRCDPANLEWSHVQLPLEMQGKDLRELHLFDGILWVATEDLLANADTRYYDWITYGPVTGAPLPGYAGLAFGEDAIWVAGHGGLGKMDPYTEEWTLYATGADILLDLVFLGSDVWLCSRTALFRFDPLYEKIRVYQAEADFPLKSLSWMKQVGDELWLFGSDGIARFNPTSETWRVIPPFEAQIDPPAQVVIQGSLVWLLFRDGFVVYDIEGESYRVPPWSSRITGVEFLDATLHQGKLYISTDQLLAVFTPEGDLAELKGDLTFPGQVDGLTKSPLVRITSTGKRLVGLGPGSLAVYLEDENEWRLRALPQKDGQTRDAGPHVRLGDSGLELSFPPAPSIKLLGSFTYLAQADRNDWKIFNSGWGSSDRHRIRLSGRSEQFTAFYDNTDLDFGDRWGGQYRGETNATLREAGAGWGTAEPELAQLLGRSGYKGGYLWAETGGRSPKRHRRAAQMNLWAGERTTGHTMESFQGGAQAYHLSRGKIVIGTVRLSIDDQLLQEGEYTLDHSSGSFFLSFQERDLVTEDSIIRVEYDYWLGDAEDRATLVIPQIMYNRGDGFTASVSAFQEASDDSTHNLISTAARWRSDPDAERRLSIEHELLVSPDESELGGRGSLSYSADRIELQFSGTILPAGIETDARRSEEFGPLTDDFELSGRLEPMRELPLLWHLGWMRTDSATGKTGSGTVLWNRTGLPSLSVEVAGKSWEGDTLSTEWKKMEVGSEYHASSVPWLSKLRVQTRLRESRKDMGARKTRYRSALGRLDLSPGGLFDLALYSWGRRADDLGTQGESRLSGDGYGRLSLMSSSLLKGIDLYARGEGRVGTGEFDEGEKDVSLDRSLLTSVVWRPGRLPVQLEATYSRSLRDALSGVDAGLGFLDVLDEVGGPKDVSLSRNRVIGGGPVIYLPRYSSLRLRMTRSEQTTADSSAITSSGTLDTYRATLDLLPRGKNRWLVEATGSSSEDRQSDTARNWSLWGRWERRWDPMLLSRASFSASRSTSGDYVSWSWAPSYYVQVGPGTRGIEFRGELGAGKRKSGEKEAWFLRSSFRLEIRALGAFLLRAEARPSIEFPADGDATKTLFLDLKAGADF